MKSKTIGAIFCLFLCGQRLTAQDAAYWGPPYGAGTFFWPGSNVAGRDDSGLYYFNPALIALRPRSSVSLASNLYEYNHTKIKDGLGAGAGLISSNGKIVPFMVSGVISFQKGKTLVLGYSLVHNPIIDYTVSYSRDAKFGVLNDSYSPGTEFYTAQYAAYNKISQTVANASVSVKLTDRLSAGLTGEATIRKQSFYDYINTRAFINSSGVPTALLPFTQVSSLYQLDYWRLGLRFRAGLAYEAGKHQLGFVVSSPLVQIKSSAVLFTDLTISNLNIPNTSLALNLLANGRQKSLPVRYKLPLSLAASYSIAVNKWQAALSAEYFLKVKNYSIVSPRNELFLRPDSGTNRDNTAQLVRFEEERKSILNAAFGLSYAFNERVTGYAALRTDFNYAGNLDPASPYQGYVPNFTTWNIYHLSAGAKLLRRKTHLYASLLTSFGTTSNYLQRVNFDTPNESNLLLGEPKRTTGGSFSLGLMLSYVHNL